MKKSKRAEKRSLTMIFIKSFAKRAAILILILMAVMTVMTFSIEAFRIKLFNFITDVTEHYTSVQVKEVNEDNENKNIIAEWKDYYLPDYIPHNYKLANAQAFGDNKVLYYKN